MDQRRTSIRIFSSNSISAPHCPWWPYVWSQRTRVRIGDDGKVPVGSQLQPIDAPPRSTVLRCLRPDGGIYNFHPAPDPHAKHIVLRHCPVC